MRPGELVVMDSAPTKQPSWAARLICAGLGLVTAGAVTFGFLWHAVAVLVLLFIIANLQSPVCRPIGRVLRSAVDVVARTVQPIQLEHVGILLAGMFAAGLVLQLLFPSFDDEWKEQHPEAFEALREMARAERAFFEDMILLSDASCQRLEAMYPEARTAAGRLLNGSSWWRSRASRRFGQRYVNAAYYCDW